MTELLRNDFTNTLVLYVMTELLRYDFTDTLVRSAFLSFRRIAGGPVATVSSFSYRWPQGIEFLAVAVAVCHSGRDPELIGQGSESFEP